MDYFKLILILYWVLLGVYYLFFNEEKKFENGRLNQIENSFPKKDRIELINSILGWCQMNIVPIKKRRIRPKIEVNMHPNGKILGYYDYPTKTICVYLKLHDNIECLVDTVIHEYVHHIQIRTMIDNRRYNKLTNQNGYKENEYEIEARSVAKNLRKHAMKDLGLY